VTKHADQLCLQAHYVAIVEAHKDAEVYKHGNVDCASCLRRMVEKHEALAEVFRSRLSSLAMPVRCRVYDTECINHDYCNDHDACCAGDPNCTTEMP
jgi:hypothetical protein